MRKNFFVALIVIFAILALSGFVYMKYRGKIVLASLQYFAEERIGKAIGAKVNIESIRPSLIGPTILEGFSLVKETSEDTPFIFRSDKLIIYNNVPQIIFDKIFKRIGFKGINLVFKIENGSLTKGNKPIFQEVNGFGKIVNNNILFNDITGKCYEFPLSVHGRISGKTSRIDLKLESASDKFMGKMAISSSIFKPHAVGVLEFNNGRKFYFSTDLDIKPGESISFENLMLQNAVLANGKVDFIKKKFYAQITGLSQKNEKNPRKNTVQIVGDFSKKNYLTSSAFFNHIGLGRTDLQSQLDCEIAFLDNGSLQGKIKSSGTILDYRPFKELEGEFSVEQSVLKIARLNLGQDYNLSGFFNLGSPYEMDLALNINDSNLSQLLLISDTDSDSAIRGKISGQIKTKGPLANPVTIARLECTKGNLGNLDYESMNINLNGTGSLLKVADSRILRKKGYIDLSGEVDLKKLWSQRPAEGLAWSCGNEAIVWEGWNIIKEANSKELEMKKGIGREKEFMVTFKSYLNDEQSWQDSEGHNQDEAIGVEYSLDDAKSVKMQLKNNEEVFSLEHKVRF